MDVAHAPLSVLVIDCVCVVCKLHFFPCDKQSQLCGASTLADPVESNGLRCYLIFPLIIE